MAAPGRWDWRLLVTVAVAGVGAVGVIAGTVPALVIGAVFVAVVRRIAFPPSASSLSLTSSLAVSATGIIVLLVFLNASAPPSIPADSRILGSVIVLGGFVPFVVWAHGWELPIPLFPAVTGIYAIYYGIPVFLTSQFGALSRPIEPGRIVPSQWIALIGLVVMGAGYYAVARTANSRRVAREWKIEPNPESETLWIWLGAFGVLVYFVGSQTQVAAELAQIVNLLGSVATLAAVELYLRWRGKRLSLVGVLYLFAFLIPARVLFGFGTGANFEALSILIAVGIAVATVTRRIPWPAVAIAIAALVVLQPIKLAFRAAPEYRASPSLATRSVGYLETAGNYFTGNGQFRDAQDAFVERYGFLTTLAAVMTDSPATVPYWKGHTYTPLLSKVFPRFLLPWKPEEVTGQTFGHRYHLLFDYDFRTSYNMPILVEWYANFGPAGVVAGMAALGAFYALAQRFAIGRLRRAFGAGSAIFVIAQLAFIESALSFVLSAFFYAVVLVYLIRFGSRLLRGRVPDAVARPLPEAAPIT